MSKRVRYLLTITLALVTSCYEESDFAKANFTFDELVKTVEIEKTNLLADGMDESLVKILFPPNTTNDTINFIATLSRGNFKNNQNDTINIEPKLETNESGNLEKSIGITIIAPKEVGTSELRLELNGFVKVINLTFERSYPDAIQVVAAPRVFSRKRVENVELKTVLFKEIGQPSFNTKISYEAVDTIGNKIGQIVAKCELDTSNTSCTALFNIWPDTSYLGRINVKGFVDEAPIDISNEISLFTIE